MAHRYPKVSSGGPTSQMIREEPWRKATKRRGGEFREYATPPSMILVTPWLIIAR